MFGRLAIFAGCLWNVRYGKFGLAANQVGYVIFHRSIKVQAK